jgi:hypothetical protein
MTQEELLAAAERYSRTATQWFRDGKETLREKEKEILTQAHLNAPGVKETVKELTKIVRELRRNQEQILEHLQQLNNPAEASVPGASAPTAARAAWRLLDDSINGWLRLKDVFPESEDAILDMLVQLDRLRRAIKEQWPGAPGSNPG